MITPDGTLIAKGFIDYKQKMIPSLLKTLILPIRTDWLAPEAILNYLNPLKKQVLKAVADAQCISKKKATENMSDQ